MLTHDNDQIQQRHLHLEEIIGLGHAAYPHRFDRTHTISSIVMQYHSYGGKREDEAEAVRVNEELKAAGEGKIRIAGRVMQMRLMGKAAFAHLSDGGARLQIYVRKNDVGDEPVFAFSALQPPRPA